MKLHPGHRCRWQAATPPDSGGHWHQGRYGEASAAAASCRQTTEAGSGRRRAPFSTDTASHTHTARSLACPLLTLSASARSFSNGIFRSDGTPCARPLLPSSDRSAGQRNQPSHDTVLARPVCPFVCVSAASFPCRFLDLGLTFILVSAYCTRARQSFPAVYVGVVECAPASPYTYSSSTHRFPDERTPIEAMPLSATSTELVRVGVWVWDWIHSHTPPRTRSPSSRHPLFTHYPFPPQPLVCGGQPSPHKPRLVVSHSTCPPLSSSPHAHSFVIGPAVINTHTRGAHLQ